MKSKNIVILLVLSAVAVLTNSSSCGGDDLKIKYEYGFFPSDTILNLEGINSQYDDINIALPQIYMDKPIVFSSNRNSSGGAFDLVAGMIGYNFNQINGDYTLMAEMLDTPFYGSITDEINSDGNEYGPLRIFNGLDGMEYLFVASDFGADNLDIKYLKYFPTGGQNPPLGIELKDASVLNSTANDAYLTFDWDYSNAYFNTDRNGNYDIVETEVIVTSSFSDWLDGEAASTSATVNINSSADDKCPFIYDTIMLFTSDRAGGMGGFDLYYSTFSEGEWGSPVNMGPRINTQYNEYRPVLALPPGFTNKLLLFSSDRPGGIGAYDLYMTGIDNSQFQ